MFVNRRFTRKGPKYSQIYVPHDQRCLNPPPRIIQTEKEAQNYYNQLLKMGYFPTSPAPEPADNYEILNLDAETDTTFTIATGKPYPGQPVFTQTGLIQILTITGQDLSKGQYYILDGDIKFQPGSDTSISLNLSSAVHDIEPTPIEPGYITSTKQFKVTSCGYIPQVTGYYGTYNTAFLFDIDLDAQVDAGVFFPCAGSIFKVPAGGRLRILHLLPVQ